MQYTVTVGMVYDRNCTQIQDCQILHLNLLCSTYYAKALTIFSVGDKYSINQ